MAPYLPSLPFRTTYTTGRQLLPGQRMNDYANLFASYSGLTALAGGGQAGSPVINSAMVSLDVVANANDSVQLPPAKVGYRISIVNNGAASAQIFGNANGTDTINATAGNVGVALANGAAAVFVCMKDGNWRRFVSA